MADTGPLGSRGEERTPSTSNRVISLLGGGGGGGGGNLIFNAGLLAAASSALFPPSERLLMMKSGLARQRKITPPPPAALIYDIFIYMLSLGIYVAIIVNHGGERGPRGDRARAAGGGPREGCGWRGAYPLCYCSAAC